MSLNIIYNQCFLNLWWCSAFKLIMYFSCSTCGNCYWATERTDSLDKLVWWFIKKIVLLRLMIYYTKCLEERFVFEWIIFSKAYSQWFYYPNKQGLWINTQGGEQSFNNCQFKRLQTFPKLLLERKKVFQKVTTV